MIQGVTYNAATPNARVAQGETIDFADLEQKKANIEQTRAETERIKRPVEDKSAEKGKEKIFGDIEALDASGVIAPDHDIAVNWINEAWNIALDPTKDFTDPQTRREIYNQVSKVKYLVDKSKAIGQNASVIRERGRGGNLIGSNEALLDIFTGELPYQDVDAAGNVISKKISAKDVKTIEDYQKYLSAQTRRLNDPFTAFDTPNFLKVQEGRVQQEAKIEKDLGGGRTQTVVLTGDDKIRYNLQDLWNDKPELQRQMQYDLSQLQKSSPDLVLPNGKKITEVDAREYFVESKLPTFRKKDVTLEGSEKYDKLTNLGGNKARIGDTIVYYYNDGKGTETIDISGVRSKADNPVLNLVDDNGNPVKARPARWVLEKGKTPYLEAEAEPTEDMKKSGFQGSWFSVKIPYNEANKGNLKYVDPFTVKETLGVTGGEGNQSAKTNVNSGSQGAKKMTQAEWNAEWAKLKKGETMVGLNGVTYTKK